MFISGSNLLECLNPAEEPLNNTGFLVEFWIESEWPASFRMFPGSPVHRDVALDPSFSVVLANLPGSVGCICGDEHGVILHITNLKCFEGWFVNLVSWALDGENSTAQWGAIPIDQSTQFIPVHLLVAIIAG